MAIERLERRIILAIAGLFLFFVALVAVSIYLTPAGTAQNTAQLTVTYEAISTQLGDRVRVQVTSDAGDDQQDPYLPWTRTLKLSRGVGGTKVRLMVDQGSAGAAYSCRITADGALVAAQTGAPGER